MAAHRADRVQNIVGPCEFLSTPGRRFRYLWISFLLWNNSMNRDFSILVYLNKCHGTWLHDTRVSYFLAYLIWPETLGAQLQFTPSWQRFTKFCTKSVFCYPLRDWIGREECANVKTGSTRHENSRTTLSTYSWFSKTTDFFFFILNQLEIL